MASVVSICNLALAHIGDEATVTAIDPPEGSQQAEHCQRYYPIARDTVLEAHTWSFATRRAALVELEDEAPDNWAFAYQRPNGCLRALAVLLPGAASDESEEFVEETLEDDTRVIYTNAEDATLRYTARIEDTTKYSALFVNALARLLAAYIAGPIIKGAEGMKVAAGQMEWYRKIDLPDAKAADANARRLNTYDDFQPASLAARL